jgi:hypothetical protein
MIAKAWVRRLAVIGIAAALGPACKGSASSAVLFLEIFSGMFPGTNWTTTGTGTAAKDATEGFPDPDSLKLSGTAGQDISAETQSGFNALAMTFSVHMAADTALGTDVGTGIIRINDNLGEVASASWDTATGNLTLKVLGAVDVVVAAPAEDLTFHRIVLKVASDGTTTWTLDNGAALMTAAAFPSVSAVTLELSATYPAGPGFALFYFDNINVTSP